MSKVAEGTKKSLPGILLLSFSTFIVCVAAPFTQVISFDLMFDLNAFPSELYAWTFPIFVAGECASMGLCAATIDRIGRRLPFLIGSILFIIFTALCAMSGNMTWFVVFRFLEGFGAGIIIVVCIAQIFFDVEDKKDRYIANGLMSLGFGGGMLVGVFAGRAFVDSIGWPVAFWIMAVMQAIVTYPCLQVLSRGERSEKKVDVPAAVLFTIAAGVFVFLLQKIQLGWSLNDVECVAVTAFLVLLMLLIVIAEFVNPDSIFHRKVHDARLTAVSMVFIVLLGVIDMGAVGFMVKVALFTYQMTVGQVGPYFFLLVAGAATTAITISKVIDRTGHLPWFILSAILSPIALLSMLLVREDDPFFMLGVHLFILGLAIGCLVSMLNATIQNRTDKHNNGSIMSFAIMVRTLSLWLGYNFYQKIADIYMENKIGGTVAQWNAILPVELPSNTTLANLLVTPLKDVIMALPGLSDQIATIFAEGVGRGLSIGAVAFVVIAVPVSLLLIGRKKTL